MRAHGTRVPAAGYSGTRDASHGPGRGAAGGEAAAAFFQQSSRDRKDPAFPRRGARARTAHC